MKTKLMQLADALAQAAFNNQMQQEAARSALEAEIDRVCKDAERYRFIRTRPEWLGWLSRLAPIPWGKQTQKEAMSAALDAVMKEPS